MKKMTIWILGSLLAGALSAFAAAPVAMRVEVEPLQQAGDNTEVAVFIQISPEDRGRIGSNAIVRIELDGGKLSSGSPMRAVAVEDDGSIRVAVVWPPGEHDLRVEIEDPSREDTGLWVGKVRIPDLAPDAPTGAVSVPAPEPPTEPPAAPAPETVEPQKVETAATTPIAIDPGETSVPMAETTSDPDEAGAASAAAAGAVMAAAPEPSVADKPLPQSSEASGLESAPEGPALLQDDELVASVPADPDPVATIPETVPEEPPSVEVEPEIVQTDIADAEPELDPMEPSTGDETVPSPIEEPIEAEDEIEIEEPAAGEEELPIVEPLRADPSPQAAAPDSAIPSESLSPAPAAVSAEAAVQYSEWEKADADTRDLSVVVMRGREPVLDVDMNSLRLRVGSTETPIERWGDAESSPLLLGLAVDVVSNEVDGWSGARGSLASLAKRATGGRGRLFVATPSGVGDWGVVPGGSGKSKGSPMAQNVARLVIASLEPFSGQRGRSFLVVLTDGRNEPTKGEWNEATEAAAAAGVPILVVALWDGDFSHRTRKNLKQLTIVSGGSLFLVQGSTQLDSAADRFGRLIDGSYALRFKFPTAPQGKATAISVTASDKTLEVTAPKSIR